VGGVLLLTQRLVPDVPVSTSAKTRHDITQSNNNDYVLADCHIHLMGDDVQELVRITDVMRNEHNIDTASLLSYGNECEDMSAQNLIVMTYKALYPLDMYAFAALHYHLPKQKKDSQDYLNQLVRFMGMGYDGIKRVDSIPWIRKLIGDIPAHSPLYDGFYDYLQEHQVPVFWHVGDPETYWDEQTCPQWAKDKGWKYYDGTFVRNEALYREVEDVLTKYPRLRIVFDHFYFLSHDLKRAGRFLDRWPTVYLTFSPGCEMYYNFSASREETKDFFVHYQNRLLFGTDMGYDDWYMPAETKIKEARDTVRSMRRFFETEDTFKPSEDPHSMWSRGEDALTGIGLPASILRKIYRDNYMRYIQRPPSPVAIGEIMDYADEIISVFSKTKVNERVVNQARGCLEILEKTGE
jgi:predicted TIM-barrel fold metal-dependent hydrolase